jgi:4-aminobutyrate aminotransferase
MAKGIAAGLPVGVTITTDEIAARWKGKSISTFGGNPIAMAGMNAALDVMVEKDVRNLAATRGGRLIAGLDMLAGRHAWIGEVRGMGLMVGLELIEDGPGKVPSPRRAKALLGAAHQEGLLVGVGGLYDQVLRLGPNLLFSESEVDEALERLGRACRRVD